MDDFIMLLSSYMFSVIPYITIEECSGLYIYVVWKYWNMCPYILIYLLVSILLNFSGARLIGSGVR
jgi:hypothetical protein